jgi:Cu(I)/Ag(I) efflux system membrane protein CusA/SilA
MIERVVRWSARNVILVFLCMIPVALAGVYAIYRAPLDALPDISDTQVIVYTELSGQAPQVVEDQITYPLATTLLSTPRAKAVRGLSIFGASFLYVIFDDDVDIYWARSRILERLATSSASLPPAAKPTLGPDATGLGWIFQYVVRGGSRSLAELRALQDWRLRYSLAQVEGVAEVASVGGFEKQYAVVVDPRLMQIHGVTLNNIREGIRASNLEVGARTIELAEAEIAIRGKGYLRGVDDLQSIVVRTDPVAPVLLKDVARIELAPAERRGVAELDGQGEVVSGVVVQRQGQNALSIIDGVKARIEEISKSLPEGVSLQAIYDRTELIHRAVETLGRTLVEECLIVFVVCILFLNHMRSALVALCCLPIGLLAAYAALNILGVSCNVMSLGGFAIAIGAMIDASIVTIENAHKRLERAPPGASRREVLINAACEVAPSLFTSLLVVTVSFLPIFVLESQEGRLFKPLAAAKTLIMAAAALLSITLTPALLATFLRGETPPEKAGWINRITSRLYSGVIEKALSMKRGVIIAAISIVAVSLWPASRLGGEFMPNLDEGALFYMPTTMPGLSIAKAAELLQLQDRIIKSFPEVDHVLGKAGRAATATDPAPTEMFETIITLKPKTSWRAGLTQEKLVAEMDAALQFPGVSNAWTMPIKARASMLATGIRTPLGVKILGPDIQTLERLAREVEAAVRKVPGAASVYGERILGARYLDIEPDRVELARRGVSVADVQNVIATAIGGETLTTTVEGRERYAVIARYPRFMRSDPETIGHDVLVSVANGGYAPLGELAKIKLVHGPAGIRTENAELAAYVYVDVRTRDIASFVEDAKKALSETVAMPVGFYTKWSGEFESYERAKKRLYIVAPATMLIIVALLYLNFRQMASTMIVLLTLPLALVGGVWLMWGLDFRLSVASAVGFIALAGVAAETGVVMLVYLDNAFRSKWREVETQGRDFMEADLHEVIVEGAVNRLRPKLMTVCSIIAGLTPIMWASGAGAEIMQRIAAPMIGGMISSTAMTLILIPLLYAAVLKRKYRIGRTGPK